VGLAAGGVAAIGVGIIVGFQARSTYDDVKALCGTGLVCNTPASFERGHRLVGDARSQAAISTMAVAAGGTLILTGLAVWLIAPEHGHAEATRVAPLVSAKDVALAVTGRF